MVPQELVGKILFFSDRDGRTQLYAFDPSTGRLAYVTQEWPYYVARTVETRSPDGRFTLVVQNRLEDKTQTPQVFLYDGQYNALIGLTATTGGSYDPVWSPQGDRIAFVSQEPGNDEIYTINPDGSNLQRLTVNSWEWDKHPSWSPDGTQIVFWSNREIGRRQLWVMNSDGSSQRRLLESPFNDWDPIWVR
jgi:TolB protein